MQSFLSCCERLHAHRADDQRWPGDSHSRVQAGATRGLGKARQARLQEPRFQSDPAYKRGENGAL